MTGDEFILRDGLIAEYRESVNGGVVIEPARMEKVFRRWTGRLKERLETLAYLEAPEGLAHKTSMTETTGRSR
jgi:hypothetical protein